LFGQAIQLVVQYRLNLAPCQLVHNEAA
jgi:hypothetical protein